MMDWTVPLDSFDGRSALDMAAVGFAKHASQRGGYTHIKGQKILFDVYAGGPFDNGAFGLYFSNVGPDIHKNDFMENIQ